MNESASIACSVRMQQVQSPVIPDVAALIRSHPGTISLGQGVVHYPPPAEVLRAVAAFGRETEEHHYQDVFGHPRLIRALHTKLETDNGIILGSDRFVMVTAGSNMAFFHCLLAICDPGDEIILLSPFYFNHEMAAVMAHARPVPIPTGPDYQPDPDRIAAAITARTRAVVTISPNNPAGVVYEPERLRAINRLCVRRGLYHICDEAYEYFTYGTTPHFSPASDPDGQARTISLYSLSKSYGMAAWRVGYAVVPAHLREALAKIQDTLLICPPAVCQVAALAAVVVGSAYCRQHVGPLDQIRRLCIQALEPLAPRCQVSSSDGAFYLLARLASKEDPMTVVRRLVEDFGVAAIPGSAFGMEASCVLRIAYGALSPGKAEAGMERLVRGLRVVLGD